MGSLTDQEVHLFGQEFQKELVRLHETKQSQSYWARMIMPREKIQQIVDHLKVGTFEEESILISFHHFNFIIYLTCWLHL